MLSSGDIRRWRKNSKFNRSCLRGEFCLVNQEKHYTHVAEGILSMITSVSYMIESILHD